MSGLAVIIPTVAANYARRQTIASERSVPQPPPEVAWVIERDGSGYRLRNEGTGTATGVRFVLPEGDDAVQVRIIDGNGDVDSNGSVGLLLTIKWSSGRQVSELPVAWEGQEDPVLVPIRRS